ncbi:DUF294 nucleotidyltransferase-like domain-containing protein [Desmospora profundinema]|uniref:CBS domain-containing protein n=1 Tax=Desmospora profundinema TaxID=1571184 RepID=A0ABU1IJX7_9BACL|nr:DUF294 nucleotidyltransferase-like domain-containing protein [Desmospora profundinema]MDR6224294.1 CBS domain-containing protein [Desmospora profundinema]
MNPAFWLEQHRGWGRWVKECLDENGEVIGIQSALQAKHDHLYQQVWEWAANQARSKGDFVPSSGSWFMMGSAGREEAPLWTDQDHGILLADDEDRERVTAFTHLLVEGLQQAGYPRCPGKVMASESIWQGTRREWKSRLEKWFAGNSRDDARYLMIAADARVVAGEREWIKEWRNHFFQLASRYPHVLRREADRRSRTPLGLWGRLHRERYGVLAGKVPIKEGGYLLMVDALRLWSLVHEVKETSTRQRIRGVGNCLGWSRQRVEALTDALDVFLEFRLCGSLEEEGNPNYVDPAQHPSKRIQRLKKAFSLSRDIWREVGRDLDRLAAEIGDQRL